MLGTRKISIGGEESGSKKKIAIFNEKIKICNRLRHHYNNLLKNGHKSARN